MIIRHQKMIEMKEEEKSRKKNINNNDTVTMVQNYHWHNINWQAVTINRFASTAKIVARGCNRPKLLR